MNSRMKKAWLVWGILVISLGVSLRAEPVVKDVKIKTVGSVAVDEQMVRSYIAVRPGRALNRGEVANDVRSLMDSGKISDVKA